MSSSERREAMGEHNKALFLTSLEGFPTDLLVDTAAEGEVILVGFLTTLLERSFFRTGEGLGLALPVAYGYT
jgi:hypothetical protein